MTKAVRRIGGCGAFRAAIGQTPAPAHEGIRASDDANRHAHWFRIRHESGHERLDLRGDIGRRRRRASGGRLEVGASRSPGDRKDQKRSGAKGKNQSTHSLMLHIPPTDNVRHKNRPNVLE
jgi:hypothetical protein